MTQSRKAFECSKDSVFWIPALGRICWVFFEWRLVYMIKKKIFGSKKDFWEHAYKCFLEATEDYSKLRNQEDKSRF